MPQSLAKLLVHLVFSTKERHPLIARELRGPLHAYIAGTLRNLECPSLQTGGTHNHVHVLFSLSRTRTLAKVVEEAKKSSSKWMKGQGVAKFSWQVGYGAFSIGQSQVKAVIDYIASQEEHHRHVTFEEELRRLLERYGVEYDERYLWD